ncbi:hypothetical protein GCM10023191_092340 [Actinoallomurus oryzae]|uniref:Uncharacterized protein n=1 Tax=Actinoallomurus oryzae TaxID=502180 RepID=A0ABP8R5Q1_9ACTN
MRTARSPRQGTGPEDEHHGDGDVESILRRSEAIGRRVAADEAARKFWSDLAYAAGWDAGYRQGQADRDEQEARRQALMHGLASTPQYRELERLRWGGRREDFGQGRARDFAGMGEDYQPAPYYTPLLPGGASRHRVQRGAA